MNLKKGLGGIALAVMFAGLAACASAPKTQTVADGQPRRPNPQVVRDPFDALQNPAVNFSRPGPRSPLGN